MMSPTRVWTTPSCSACMRMVQRRYGFRPGDDVISSLGRGVIDAVIHVQGEIQVVATFGEFSVTLHPNELTKDPDGATARKAATWAMGVGDE